MLDEEGPLGPSGIYRLSELPNFGATGESCSAGRATKLMQGCLETCHRPNLFPSLFISQTLAFYVSGQGQLEENTRGSFQKGSCFMNRANAH